MEQRLSLITLGVKDLKKSRGFYDSLGWKIANKEDSENVVAYDLQNMTLALFPWEDLAKDADISTERTGYSSITLAYNVRSEKEVLNTLETVKGCGGKIIKNAQETFWGGFSGYFADIDGHLWEVAYNPFSELGPNGEFQWKGFK